MKNTDEILFDDHNHFFTGEVTGESVEKAIRWIMMGAHNTSLGHPMKLYINSEGGNLIDAFALIDVMRTSPVPIITVGMGNLMSSAFMIFAAGTKGQRAIAKNTSIMIHQFNHEISGKYHDLKTFSQEFDRINQRMVDILCDCSNMSEDDVKKYLLGPTDNWMDAYQLKEYGIADYIF
jgi:ATP-dependent Clp protease protease subunit